MLLHLAVFMPFIGALLVPLIYYYNQKLHPGYIALIIPIISCILLLTAQLNGLSESRVQWMPHLHLNLDFHLDGLSFLFVMLITVIGALVIFYSIHYLNRKEALGHFYTYLLLFMGAMLGVVLSDNVLSLYMFWELTSISSFLLIAFWHHKAESLAGALKSMLITVFGGLMLLGGLLILVAITHTFSLREMMQYEHIEQSPLFIPAVLFILLAAFTKSAQFPFHIWLPDAMEAPTPVSAYLHSATMVKAGVYLVARLTPIFAVSSTWIYALTLIGALTLFWASFNAVKQQDLKGILAYSTVSQLGLMMTLLGVGAISYHYHHDTVYYMAVAACVFHIFNHASFKGALFMVVGIIDHEAGTRDLKKLSGLMMLMPVTFTIAVTASLSMAGIPPFNGFLSKEMFLTSMFDSAESGFFNPIFTVLILLLVIIGSLFTFIYSIKWIKDVFFGAASSQLSSVHDAPRGMLLSPFILSVIVITVGLFPGLVTPLINDGTASTLNRSVPEVHIAHWHGFNTALMTTLGIFLVGALLIYFEQRWLGIYRLQKEQWTFNHLYRLGLERMDKAAYFFNHSIVIAGIRLHLSLIFGFLTVITVMLLWKAQLGFGQFQLSEVRIYELILIVIILVATWMIIRAQSRLFSIIMLSAVGYSMGLFFVFFNAPDLALTQLTIETISTALFLMCFYHLPKMSRSDETRKFQLGNAVISIVIGAIVTIIALIAYSHRYYPSIADYYIKNVYTLGAGKNMVNVILVDFRGFDTLFESSVLGIAGIGIYTLIKLRKGKDEDNEQTE